MEVNPATNTGGGGGGPAPFLLKTYDMVDDTSTDEIVSWSSGRNSFVVWNPPEFARILLPTYFKHNNFSSFIRQLNTYGFRKIDPERWEFANEEFVKDQKHLLKNIHRRKPIHSHSNPQGSAVDPERAAFEEEIDKLSREKSALEANLLRYKKQQPIAKLQLEDLTHRIDSMEQKQESLLTFLEKAVHSPYFVENLAQKLESIDFTAYSKKRRLPQGEQSQTAAEDSFVDNQSTSRPEFVNIIQQDFSSRLRLELSPAVSDINLVSHSTQSSTEDLGSPQRRIPEECLNNAPTTRPGGLLFAAPETLELSDTGTSFTLNMDSSFSCKTMPSERVHCTQRKLNTNDEADGLISCHLNLTLASSSPLQVEKSQTSGRIGRPSEWLTSANPNEGDLRISEKNIPCSDGVVNDQGPPAAQAPRVNDVFWEQFLTERPGSSDVEEASSSYKVNAAYDEQEDRRSGGYGMSRNARNLEHLTL